MVTHTFRIHQARADTCITSHTLIGINAYTEECYRIEKRIYRAQRTDKTTECSEADHAHENAQGHDKNFPRKKESHFGLQYLAGTYKRDTCFKSSGGTYVFAKTRSKSDYGDRDHEDSQNDIFQVRENGCESVLPDLGKRDLIEQFLDQSERTQEAAYDAPE